MATVQNDPCPDASPSPLRGLARNPAGYGDAEFSIFLRKAFIKALGYTDDALDRPVVADYTD